MDPQQDHNKPPTQPSELVVQCCDTDELRRQMQTTLLAMDKQENYPGIYDHVQFASSIDPHAFIGGFLNGKIVSMVCICNYNDEFSFLGTFLTWPEYQRQGIGARVFREALRHAGDRTVGLISNQRMADWYEKQGFLRIGTYSVFEFTPKSSKVPEKQNNAIIVPVSDVDFDELHRFDRKYFPAERKNFLHAWLTHSKITCLVYKRDAVIQGYGAIRQCTGDKVCKMGPLFAGSSVVAEEIAVALLNRIPEGIEKVLYECYNDNQQTKLLAVKLGFQPTEHDGVVMYKNGRPKFDVSGVYTYTNGGFG